MQRILSCWLTMFVMLVFSSHASESGTSGEHLLLSEDIADRVTVTRIIRMERERRIQGLKAVLQATGTKPASALPEAHVDPKALAIGLLGDLRAVQVVETLFKDIEYEVRSIEGGYASRSLPARFPAIRALAQIGKAASRQAVEELLTTDNTLRRQLCLWILREVEGPDLAKVILELRLKEVRDRRKGDNIRKALDVLEQEVSDTMVR